VAASRASAQKDADRKRGRAMDAIDTRTLRRPDNDSRAPSMARIVETQVIPRLLMTQGRNRGPVAPTAAHIDTLTRLALSRDPGGADAQVTALRRDGMPAQMLLDMVVAPSARLLGDLWRQDALSFIDVAMGCGRLAAIVRRIGMECDPWAEPGAPHALVTSLPGERHGLGPMIFAHHLRDAGWIVSELPGASAATLRRLSAEAPWDMVALSLGDSRGEAQAAETLSMIRAAARPNNPIVAIGGPAALLNPNLARDVGADFSAAEAAEAVLQADELLSQRDMDAKRPRSA
jgi:methanogenic corrinoid protein MtbC1